MSIADPNKTILTGENPFIRQAVWGWCRGGGSEGGPALGADETFTDGEAAQGDSIVNGELGHEAGFVGLDRLHAAVQVGGDLFDRQAEGEQSQPKPVSS